MVYEAVADPHDQEGEARIGGGEVDHDRLLAALRLVDSQQVGAEVGTQPATVPWGLCQEIIFIWGLLDNPLKSGHKTVQTFNELIIKIPKTK